RAVDWMALLDWQQRLGYRAACLESTGRRTRQRPAAGVHPPWRTAAVAVDHGRCDWWSDPVLPVRSVRLPGHPCRDLHAGEGLGGKGANDGELTAEVLIERRQRV